MYVYQNLLITLQQHFHLILTSLNRIYYKYFLKITGFICFLLFFQYTYAQNTNKTPLYISSNVFSKLRSLMYDSFSLLFFFIFLLLCIYFIRLLSKYCQQSTTITNIAHKRRAIVKSDYTQMNTVVRVVIAYVCMFVGMYI